MGNLNNKKELMAILLKIEFSLHSPLAARYNKKCCPYCGRHDHHDPECRLNASILQMMDGVYTQDSKKKIHAALKEVEWCGFNNICPCCGNSRINGHKNNCEMKGVDCL